MSFKKYQKRNNTTVGVGVCHSSGGGHSDSGVVGFRLLVFDTRKTNVNGAWNVLHLSLVGRARPGLCSRKKILGLKILS